MEILEQAVDYGFVDFTTVFGDSTHQKANANKRKSVKKEVEILKKKYEDDLLVEINEDKEYADEIRHTMEWKEIYPQRKETIERVFADCKENNGLRFTRLKGLKKNQQNVWLIFACHNL